MAGVVVLGATLVTRMSGGAGPIASVVLDEPAGTRVGGVALAPDRLAVTLLGGGVDRVVIVDTKAGRVLGRLELKQ